MIKVKRKTIHFALAGALALGEMRVALDHLQRAVPENFGELGEGGS